MNLRNGRKMPYFSGFLGGFKMNPLRIKVGSNHKE